MDTIKLTDRAVTEYQTETGPADYALFIKVKLLGIIEANVEEKDGPMLLHDLKEFNKSKLILSRSERN
jgi:type I restriction enzyme R subunit